MQLFRGLTYAILFEVVAGMLIALAIKLTR